VLGTLVEVRGSGGRHVSEWSRALRASRCRTGIGFSHGRSMYGWSAGLGQVECRHYKNSVGVRDSNTHPPSVDTQNRQLIDTSKPAIN
jgi:hypothetical protein